MMCPATGVPVVRARNAVRPCDATLERRPTHPAMPLALLWWICLSALIPGRVAADAGAMVNTAPFVATAESPASTRVAGVPVILAMPAAAQLPGPPFPRYDNPADRPLPPCTCRNLEELQDQLESAEFASKAFEEAAANSRAGPGDKPQIEVELDQVGKNDPPSIRTSVTPAFTNTSTSACEIQAVETRRTAPCKEIYEAFRAHEEHHREICLHYWKNQGNGPVNFQTGREYFLEEALAYRIAAKVYRRVLEKILENSRIEVEFTLEHAQDPSRFDAHMKTVLTTPSGVSGDDGQVEWFGKGAMCFSDIVHDTCSAPDMSREDVMVARTEDFRVLSFQHKPGGGLANYRCKKGGSFSAPMPALLAEQWKQYLLRDAGLEVAAFGGTRGISELIDLAGQRGLTHSAVAMLQSALGAVQQPLHPPRTSYPWSPLVGRKVGEELQIFRLNRGPTSITDLAKMGGRAELYVDDDSPGPNVKITSDVHLICP